MALDEQREKDLTFNEQGITSAIEELFTSPSCFIILIAFIINSIIKEHSFER